MPEQEIQLEGHLLDSLTLPKVMDLVLEEGGNCELLEVRIGKRKVDLSFARLLVGSQTAQQMERIFIRRPIWRRRSISRGAGFVSSGLKWTAALSSTGDVAWWSASR